MAFSRTFGIIMRWCSLLIVVGVFWGIECWSCQKNNRIHCLHWRCGLFSWLFYHLIWIDFGLYSTVSHKLRCLLWLESATNEIHIVKIWTRNSLATHHTCTITSETSLHCLNNSVDPFPQRSSIILLKTLFEIWTEWRCAIYWDVIWRFYHFNSTEWSCISLYLVVTMHS